MRNPSSGVFLTIIVTLIFTAFIGNDIKAQRDVISFERISVENGLSQNTVYTILRDHKGFMWFGTEDGLNRFDGYGFKVFANVVSDKSSLSNNRVIAMIEDRQNRLWIGTIGGGLNQFIWEDESFRVYKHEPTDELSLSNNRVMALVEDSSGKIWIGTADGGVNLFDPETGQFKRYQNTTTKPGVLPSNVVRTLFIDSNKQLWVGTENGVAIFDPQKDAFTPFDVKQYNGASLDVGVVRRFFEDSNGCVWIATELHGVICYNPNKNVFTFVRKDISTKNSLPSNTVHDIYQDDEGNMWFATFGGLSKYEPQRKRFINHTSNLYDSKSISSNLTRCLFEDQLGVFWVGTQNNGVSKFNRKCKKFIVYRNFPGNIFDIPSTTVRSIFEDKDGIIWIGTYGEGILNFDIKNENFTYFKAKPNTPGALPSNFVTSITQDKRGNIWVGTINGIARYNRQTRSFESQFNNSLPEKRIRYLLIDSQDVLWVATLNRGLVKLMPNGNTFKSYRFSPNVKTSLSQDRLTSLFEDSFGNFWIATSNEGLNLFDRESGHVIKVFRKDAEDSKTIASDRVLSFYQDKQNRLWFGTAEGVSLYSYTDSTFTNFTTRQGLPNDVIYGIVGDSEDRLWLTTNKGISCMDKSDITQPKFRNYDKHDGFPVNEFSEGAFSMLRSGNLLFGGINNFIVFNPNQIKDNQVPPSTYITECRIEGGESIRNGKVDLVLNVLEKDTIKLSFTQNNLTFAITALHFVAPEKNIFMYKLEGFDNTWIRANANQRLVKYTNLKPGEYTFKVKASNLDGYWNEEGDSLYIIIKSPFWNRWWFYVLISLVFTLIAYGLIKLREEQLIKSKILLENMVADRTVELSRQREELLLQSDRLQLANDEIKATSAVLAAQNELLTAKNEEITLKSTELEEQKNSLANLAWELQDKNEEITAQRNEIERQKKEITDSIFYAQRIQHAVLPTQEQLSELFDEFFIFNRPKSIVSGDFYWATRIGKHRVIAVVDCTGHGVPGGFMSMLGVLMLNEVISLRGILDPAKALNQLRQGIISVLHQKGDFSDAADGMDLSLCIIDDERRTLTYAGANSSMVIFEPSKPNQEGVTVFRSNRMPIAYHPMMKSFTNEVYNLTNETVLFLFTDGVFDQFGGNNNKKFQQTRFVDFVVENKDLPIETQGIVLEQVFDKWKGKTYQVDDVLVLGLKV